MLKEFREFINRGNVIDLAVAVILGTALTAVVTALVDNIIMPVVGAFLGGIDFAALAVRVGEAEITYGAFIQAVIDFLIIAFVVFLIVRSINRMRERRSAVQEEPAPAADPVDIGLLREIRDILKTRRP